MHIDLFDRGNEKEVYGGLWNLAKLMFMFYRQLLFVFAILNLM